MARAEGGRSLYFVVMRVCGGGNWVISRMSLGEKGTGRTVVGRA